MRRPSIARPNPVTRVRDFSRRTAQLAVTTPDTAAPPQATNRGGTDTGSIDGSGNWQAVGRLSIDGLSTEMRLS